MIRLSARDLARLSAAAQAKAAPPQAKGADAPRAKKPRRASTPGAEASWPSTSRRMARRIWDGGELEVMLDFPPRPKERARTFVDDRALARAFASAAGNTQRFMTMIKGKSSGGEGGIMRSVTPEDTRRYEEAIALVTSRALSASGMPPYACPLEMDIHFYFEGDPTTWPTAQSDGDLDNLVKAVLDGMEKGGAFGNDRTVVRQFTVKECASRPGILIRTRPAAP